MILFFMTHTPIPYLCAPMFYFYTIYNNDICQLDQQVMGSFLHLKQFDQEFASRDQLQKVGLRQVYFTIYR